MRPPIDNGYDMNLPSYGSLLKLMEPNIVRCAKLVYFACFPKRLGITDPVILANTLDFAEKLEVKSSYYVIQLRC